MRRAPKLRTRRRSSIRASPGFGPTIATGFVMLYHLADFAVANTPSRESLSRLGFAVGRPEDLAPFEAAIQQLMFVVDDRVGTTTAGLRTA